MHDWWVMALAALPVLAVRGRRDPGAAPTRRRPRLADGGAGGPAAARRRGQPDQGRTRHPAASRRRSAPGSAGPSRCGWRPRSRTRAPGRRRRRSSRAPTWCSPAAATAPCAPWPRRWPAPGWRWGWSRRAPATCWPAPSAPRDGVAAATRVALTGDDRKIDVGRIRVDGAEDERVFLVMAGTGFDAAIMENTPEALKVRVGPLAYVISGLRAMRGRRTRVTLTLDDGPAAAPPHPHRRRRQQRHPARRAGADAAGVHRRRRARRRQHRAEQPGRLARGGRCG